MKSVLACIIVSVVLLAGCDDSQSKSGPTTVPTPTAANGGSNSGGRQPGGDEVGRSSGAGHGTDPRTTTGSSAPGTGGSAGDPTGGR